MQYAYTSMRTVIGDVIRNTRVQDTSYIVDMHDWISQAMEQLHTGNVLQSHYESIDIDFHKGKLPCGLVYIDAVEHCSHRLRERRSGRPAEKDRRIRNNIVGFGDNAFVENTQKVVTVPGHSMYETSLTKIIARSLHPTEYYYTEMGMINTSFADGKVTIYYRAVPVDEDGMPLIPDNPNLKLALYWFCRAMMIGAGWEDRQFKFDYCMHQFEQVYAPRALAEIRLPSPEEMEHRIDTFVRFIPNMGYYDSFFQTDRPEKFYETKYF